MSKSPVAIAKEEQGYTKDAPKCSNCMYFTQDIAPALYSWSSAAAKNKRCSIGTFAVRVTGWCESHARVGSEL